MRTAFSVAWYPLLVAFILGITLVVPASAPEPDYVLMKSASPGGGASARLAAKNPRASLLAIAAENEGDADSNPDACANELPVLDVMILYTPQARAAYGDAEVRSRCTLGIAYLNEAFRRSGVHARARLVYMGETVWHREQPRALDELYWLASDNNVASLREKVGADLVSLLAKEALPTGGIAQLPGAFSVFNGSPYVFTHEAGHNLGCAHDRPHADSSSDPEACNYGYSFTPAGSGAPYGDVMSYVGSQIQQFSTPDRFFMGEPTGLPEGHVDAGGAPDAADNVHVLNQSIPYRAGGMASKAPALTGIDWSPDGTEFRLRMAGPDQVRCQMERTADGQNWEAVADCVLDPEGTEIVDGQAVNRHRLYRARFDGDWISLSAGYLRMTLPPGFSMISNPFECRDNTVATLFPTAPEGVQVFKWDEGRQRWECSTYGLGSWDQPGLTLHPGEGVIIKNGSAADWAIRLAGECDQTFYNRVPVAHSIRSSAIPVAGQLSSVLGYVPFGSGGQIYKMTAGTGSYRAYTWDGESWSPEEPTVEMGEAFWCRNPLNALIWQKEMLVPPVAD